MLSRYIQIYLQYDNNVSYGVVNVLSTPPIQEFTCETNLSYDIVKKKDHSTVSQSSPAPLYESVQQNKVRSHDNDSLTCYNLSLMLGDFFLVSL